MTARGASEPEKPGKNTVKTDETDTMVVVYLEGEIVIHEACTIDSQEENSIRLHGGNVHVLPRKDRPNETPVFLAGLPEGRRQGLMASFSISYSGVPFVVMEKDKRLQVMDNGTSDWQ